MKTKKIIISLAILIVTIIIFSSMTVFASVSTRRAYSIGVEHSTGDNHAGDFTYNIDKAASYYGQISSVTGSYYNYNPTKSYLTDDGPDGIRRIGSPIVF